MLPTMVLIGLAFTLVYGPLTIVATDGVDDERAGPRERAVQHAFQFGAALGLAVVAAVVAAATGAGGDAQALAGRLPRRPRGACRRRAAGAGRHAARPHRIGPARSPDRVAAG